MTPDEWVARIRRAFVAAGEDPPPEVESMLLADMPSEPTADELAFVELVREFLLREILRVAADHDAFGDPRRIATQFGESLEDNYGLSSGPFIDVAHAYWTFKIEFRDLFPAHRKSALYSVLGLVEQDIGSVFFPTPGPITAPVDQRREMQRHLLTRFAPTLDVERFLAESPILSEAPGRSSATVTLAPDPGAPPTKWLDFCVYIRLPLMAVTALALPFIEGALSTSELAGTILVAGPISTLLIILAVGLHRRRLWAWKALWILLVAEWLIFPIRNEIPELPAYVVALVLGGLIWMWPNYVYFTKRRVLFF